MDNSRKKLRVCLICVVVAAVIIGLCYYYVNVKGNKTVNDGTLITNVCVGMKSLWR